MADEAVFSLITSQIDTTPKPSSLRMAVLWSLITSQIDTTPKRDIINAARVASLITSQIDTTPKRVGKDTVSTFV